MTIDLAAPIVEIATPAFVLDNDDDRFMDWAGASALAETRPDIGWILGNYAQFGGHNRNGNLFVAKDRERAASRVKHTPLNMWHRKQNIIGTFVGSQLIDPAKAGDALAPKDMPHPYIESLSGMWRYHFKDAWTAIQRAFNEGAAFLSMECVAETITCMQDRCICGNRTYPYRGLRDDSYCDSLNRPRAMKALNEPWFVGGGMIIPPARPGWDKADVLKVAAMLEDHGLEAEYVYQQFAEAAPHLEAAEWELMMNLVLCAMHAPDLTANIDFDRVFAEFIPSIDLSKSTTADQMPSMGVRAAGLAVVAQDSGRVLMLQRPLDPEDPAGGTWEFPGGVLEPGETPLDAAQREWSEELGCDLPDGTIVATWTSPNGVYQGFVYLVASESDVACNMDHANRSVLNPDDPDGENIEVASWFDPEHLPMPAMRAECAECDDWMDPVKAAPSSGQIAKPDVNYRAADDPEDNPEDMACGNCCYFDAADGSCCLVAGDIAATDVCDLWTPMPDPAPVAATSMVTREGDM